MTEIYWIHVIFIKILTMLIASTTLLLFRFPDVIFYHLFPNSISAVCSGKGSSCFIAAFGARCLQERWFCAGEQRLSPVSVLLWENANTLQPPLWTFPGQELAPGPSASAAAAECGGEGLLLSKPLPAVPTSLHYPLPNPYYSLSCWAAWWCGREAELEKGQGNGWAQLEWFG